MAAVLRSLLVESELMEPSRPRRRDVVVAASLLFLGFADIPEGVTMWQPATTLAGLAAAGAVVWRRTHPLVAVTFAFAAQFLVELFSGFADVEAELPSGQLLMLAVLAYALTRWAGWRDVVTGAAAMVVLGVAGQLVATTTDWGEMSDEMLTWGLGAAIGTAIHYRAASLRFRADQVRFEERERIARELHDVVAHHVSAIAIQAEGARAVAHTDPAIAGEALTRIHRTASRALVDMRRVVSILRRPDNSGTLAPHAGMDDIRALATSGTEIPSVEVSIDGDVDTLPAGVSAALSRIAQEAVTNVRRHAEGARAVSITVSRHLHTVSLAIADDGKTAASHVKEGYGLVGMNERATMLGGTFSAGPRPGGVGWLVQVSIPVGG